MNAAEARSVAQRALASGLLSLKPKVAVPRVVVKEWSRPRPRKVRAVCEARVLAAEHGVNVATVYGWMKKGVARKEGGVWVIERRPNGAPPQYDWAVVDWSRRNVEIAKELGCSPSAVEHRRRKLTLKLRRSLPARDNAN